MGLFDKLKKIFNNNNNEDVKVYDKGLSKTRNSFFDKLNVLNSKYNELTEDYFEELEYMLIVADIGVNTVIDFMVRLRSRIKKENITDTSLLTEIIIDELFIIYVDKGIISSKINYNLNGPTIILFVGVNGVGKTTSIAKIAYQMKKEGKKVLLIAGDTFRAGAIEQLREWGTRVGVETIYGKEGIDPSSVIYDGLKVSLDDKYDCVLIDTAGRLQNKTNLMNELAKINKVIGNFIPNAPHETLLVIDSTTGQNGISQAEAFKSITNITGIILTKLDGTAKGGIVLAIKEKVDIPVKYIGLGEKLDDMRPFDIEKYIYGLFKGIDNNG